MKHPNPASCSRCVSLPRDARDSDALHDAGPSLNQRRSAASRKAWRSRRKMLAAIREGYGKAD